MGYIDETVIKLYPKTAAIYEMSGNIFGLPIEMSIKLFLK